MFNPFLLLAFHLPLAASGQHPMPMLAPAVIVIASEAPAGEAHASTSEPIQIEGYRPFLHPARVVKPKSQKAKTGHRSR